MAGKQGLGLRRKFSTGKHLLHLFCTALCYGRGFGANASGSLHRVGADHGCVKFRAGAPGPIEALEEINRKYMGKLIELLIFEPFLILLYVGIGKL